jgi:hypothetical protein
MLSLLFGCFVLGPGGGASVSPVELGRARSHFGKLPNANYKQNTNMTHPVILFFPQGRADVCYVYFEEQGPSGPGLYKEQRTGRSVKVDWHIKMLQAGDIDPRLSSPPDLRGFDRVINKQFGNQALPKDLPRKIHAELASLKGLAAYLLMGRYNRLSYVFVTMKGGIYDSPDTLTADHDDPPNWPLTLWPYPITKTEMDLLKRPDSTQLSDTQLVGSR